MRLPEPAYEERRAAALEQLADGEPERAFDGFRWTLWYRSGLAPDPARLSDALGVLSRIVVAMGHRELAEACARASAGGGADALYELGYELIEAGLPAIAATVLARCLALAPDSEAVVTELVAALERLLLHAEAKAVLAAHPALIETSFVCRYLYAWDAAMSGDLALTRTLAPGLVATDATQAFMAARIASLLARADRVVPTELRGWHHVITGGVLLHRAAAGFDDGMNGRYAYLTDAPSLQQAGIERLAGALAAWGVAPPCVYAPPGAAHERIGDAAAERLGVPRAPWPAIGIPAPGLVVAHDLADVAPRDLERLVDRRAGQLLYAHAAGWTEDGPVAPDIVMLLHQHLAPGDAGELDASHDDLPGLAALVATVGPPEAGRRERLWAGSPVPSNRFG